MTQKILVLIAAAFIVGMSVDPSKAEDALRDSFRNPTLLFDQAGQPKRVSETSPLPVTMGGQTGSSAVVIATQTLPVPVKISSQTVPLSVTVNNQPSTMTVTVGNQSTPVPVSVSTQSLPLPVTVSTQTQPVPVRISSQTIPLNVNVTNQPSTMTVTIGNQLVPIPVTVTSPIPSSTMTLSVGVERIGPGTITLITPAAGKRIAIRGAAIMMETSTGGEADVRFAGGQVVFKVYRGDQSGAVIPVFRDGNVNEIVQAVATGIAGGAKVFFVVNYEEK